MSHQSDHLDTGLYVVDECRWGATPLQNALLGGHDLVCDLIRSFGGRLELKHAPKSLGQAASAGDVRRISLLVENGVPVDMPDYDGRTALHLAATEGHLLAVYILLHRYGHIRGLVHSMHSCLGNAEANGQCCVYHGQQRLTHFSTQAVAYLQPLFSAVSLCRAREKQLKIEAVLLIATTCAAVWEAAMLRGLTQNERPRCRQHVAILQV